MYYIKGSFVSFFHFILVVLLRKNGRLETVGEDEEIAACY